MQTELLYRKPSMMARDMSSGRQSVHRLKEEAKDFRETIHSGHFMVSDFEAEAQDDEDELAVPVPEEEAARIAIIAPVGLSMERSISNSSNDKNTQLNIEISLSKLLRCMSLAYRQKLTSPKWNRFKGIRLRWKDKIRLNNVIWRCWHMQFILRQNTLVCQFASPLDVDTHNKPEAVVLEGKYWKRKLAAVTAEYKKWRMFYRNKILGWSIKDGTDMLETMDMLDWDNGMCSAVGFTGSVINSHGDSSGTQCSDAMMVDEDYMQLMTDTLFSTITSNQPLYFPDPREIARGASLADFIQPSLGPLQPNLEDFMDTLEPLQEFLNSKLPPVPEEDDIFRSGALNSNYSDLDLMSPMNQVNQQINEAPVSNNATQAPTVQRQESNNDMQNLQYTAKIYTTPHDSSNVYRGINDNYSSATDARANYDNSGMREKITRTGRSTTRGNRLQQTFPHSPQHQIIYPSRPSYNPMDLQSVQLNPTTTVAIGTLSNATPSNSQLDSMENHVNNLVGQSNFIQPNPSHDHQSRSLRPLATSQQLDPFKIVQPQNIVLQCKSSGLDLTAPALHPTKLLPRAPTVNNTEKEEVFAVPKYQMKARSRSRSSSALSTQRSHPPPLVSAISDPSLNINQNVLLAQLLTNNTSSLYTVTSGPEKVMPSSSIQVSSVKNILPMLPSTSVVSNTHLITTPITIQTLHTASGQNTSGQVMLATPNQSHTALGSPGSPKDNSNAHSPQAPSISPLHSPMSIGSPMSPSRSFAKGEPERGKYNEQRRVGHIHAEQKRRYNIKNGFDMLHSLIPQLNQSSNTKISKAALLQKGADYIRQLRLERNLLKDEMDSLKHQIECLNTSISNSQSMLPATGAPVSRQRTNKMKEMFDEYVRKRTRENWKFWIFSILLEPLMISFNTSVSTASVEDLCSSTIHWVDQHCSLVNLRPAFLNSLRYLSTSTEILSDPGRLPEEALAAVNHDKRRSPQ